MTKKTILTDLAQREKKIADAKAASHKASRELRDAVEMIEALHDERRKLVHSDPELITHTGEPVDKNNAVALVDRKLSVVPDADELRAKSEHTSKIHQRGEQGLADFIARHADEMAVALLPETESLQEEASQKLAEAQEAAQRYVAGIQRFEVLTKRHTRALDPAASIAAQLEAFGYSSVVS